MPLQPTSDDLLTQAVGKLYQGLSETDEDYDAGYMASPADLAVHVEPTQFQKTPYIDFVNRKIVETIENSGRLIIEAPVRHGKSLLSSRWTPAWFINKYPAKKVILAAYEHNFAAGWGRQVRNTIVSNPDAFDVKISSDLSSSSVWETTQGGGMVTAGVRGPLTGRGGDLLLLDDPIKNFEEAESALVRQRIFDWWTSTAYTRVEPGGAVIIIMARWHRDDIVGRLTGESDHDYLAESEDPEVWDRVRLPAIAGEDDPLGREPGEALWPERYPIKQLHRIKSSVGTKVFSSLYQQNPRREEGRTFRREWFQLVDDYPRDARIVRAWDLAGTEQSGGTDPDWTVGVKIAYKNGQYWFVDMKRTRTTPYGVEQLVKSTAQEDGREVEVVLQQDPGQAGKDQVDRYKREILPGFVVKSRPARRKKELRADIVASAAEAGNVSLLRKPWNKTLLDEFEEFPEGTHDDIVDAGSLGVEETGGGGATMAQMRGPELAGTTPSYWSGI